MMLFEAVKQSVTTRQAAEYYQLRVDRKGLVACPFHNDRTPSMKVDARFHCFGCGEGGGLMQFVMRIEGLDFVEALKLLADRAGIALPEDGDIAVDNKKHRLKQRIY